MQAVTEDHILHLDGSDQPAVEPFPAEKPQGGSHHGENNVLAVDVGRRLSVIESEDLKSRQFPHALRNVDVGKVEEYQKSKRCRRAYDDPDYDVQTLHALVEVIPGLVNTIVGNDAFYLHNPVSRVFCRLHKQYIVARPLSEYLFITGSCHMDVVADIILADSSHCHRVFFLIAVEEGYRITLFDPEVVRQFLVYDNRVVRRSQPRQFSHFAVSAKSVRPRVETYIILRDGVSVLCVSISRPSR